MADDATVIMQATVLPDEIAKSISATTTVAPADANDKWYYKLTTVPNTSQNLIAGSYTDYTAVDSATAPNTVDAADLVKFLFVKNNDPAESIYIVLDGDVVTSSIGDGILVGPNQSLAIQVPNATVDDIHAISSVGNVECIVAALLDDVA